MPRIRVTTEHDNVEVKLTQQEWNSTLMDVNNVDTDVVSLADVVIVYKSQGPTLVNIDELEQRRDGSVESGQDNPAERGQGNPANPRDNRGRGRGSRGF